MKFLTKITALLILCYIGMGTAFAAPESTEVFAGGSFLGSTINSGQGSTSSSATSSVLHDYTGGVGNGSMQVRNFMNTTIDFLKRLLIPVAFIIFTWAGIELFLSRGDEDTIKNKQNQLLATAVGFGLISLTYAIVDKVFFGAYGEILVMSDSQGFASSGVIELQGIISFATSFLVVIGILFLVVSAFRLILSGENEDELNNVKKQMIYSSLGIAIVISIATIVKFFQSGNEMKYLEENQFHDIYALLIRYANILLSFIGIIAVISLIWGGVRLIANFGDESAMEDAKKIMIYSAVALVLAYSAYTIAPYFMVIGA